MTALFQVRDGLKAALETIDGLNVVDYVPDNVVSYPTAIIYPPTFTDYGDAISDGGSITVTFLVIVLAPSAIDRQQLDLYDLLDKTGPTSIFQAVMADRTLGGLAVDCWVVNAADPLDRGRIAETFVYQRAITIQAIVS